MKTKIILSTLMFSLLSFGIAYADSQYYNSKLAKTDNSYEMMAAPTLEH